MSTSTVKVPPNTVLILGGTPYKLVWDKAAMFRADEIGVFGKRRPGIGLAQAAKYVWCMLPAGGREALQSPEEVAVALPALTEVWVAVNNAIAAGGEATDPKNVVGSTSGRSRASS